MSYRQATREIEFALALLFVVLLLMVQMWLLTATLESYLAGHHDVALPGLLTSLVLFAACFAIYRLVVRLDRVPESAEERPTDGSGPLVDRLRPGSQSLRPGLDEGRRFNSPAHHVIVDLLARQGW